MPRPRKPKREESEPRDTPFRHVLIDFMWNRRNPLEPPMSQGQLAVRLGMPRTTLTHWLNGTITPTLDVVFDVLARLGIPVQRLVDEYRAMGLTVPPLFEEDTRESGPAPRPYVPPTQPRQDPWQEMIDRTAASMRELGMDEATIAAIADHIRDRQHNRNPYDRYIRAEHAPELSPEHAEQRQSSTEPSTELTPGSNGSESQTQRGPSSPSDVQQRRPRARSNSRPQP